MLGCCSFPMRRNSVVSWFSFSLFVDIHDWTEAKQDCRPFNAAAELAIISIEMVRDSMPRNQGPDWSGIEEDQKLTPGKL